jgi:hypothetical protein
MKHIRISDAMKARWRSPASRDFLLKKQQDGRETRLAKLNYKKAAIKRWENPETRARIMANHWSVTAKRGSVISKNSKWHKDDSKRGGSHYSKKHMKKMAVRSWVNKDSHVKATLAGNRIKPNRKECRLMALLNGLFPGEYKYVGDGDFIVGGKCPDFLNINGQKKLIEMFGNYWHRGEDPSKRINHFLKYGYNTLIVWEKELQDEMTLKRKLAEFND